MAGEEFRATLCGSDATLGVVRAQDVARLIVGLESAAAAAASSDDSAGRSEMRILFIFDPERRAVLLVAGDKASNWKRWVRPEHPGGRSEVRSMAERAAKDGVAVDRPKAAATT